MGFFRDLLDRVDGKQAQDTAKAALQAQLDLSNAQLNAQIEADKLKNSPEAIAARQRVETVAIISIVSLIAIYLWFKMR